MADFQIICTRKARYPQHHHVTDITAIGTGTPDQPPTLTWTVA